MVDLFGKKKLEDRVMELEAAKASLEHEKEEFVRTLEKREEKIRKLTSANQEANLALKAAEQKAAAAAVSISPVLRLRLQQTAAKRSCPRSGSRAAESWICSCRDLWPAALPKKICWLPVFPGPFLRMPASHRRPKRRLWPSNPGEAR